MTRRSSSAIERVIVGHFRASTAAAGAIDIFVDPGTNGPAAATDWLSRNSFGRVINKKQMMDGYLAGKYAVPDIITNRGAFAKSEFYEIKAKSAENDGVAQIARFTQLTADFKLLFFPGTDYDPNMSVPFGTPIVFAGDTYDIQLKWFRHGLGLILDIVPNHRGVGGGDNAWWMDVLEWGRASRYADAFDIDWMPPDPALRGKVMAPFLGDS